MLSQPLSFLKTIPLHVLMPYCVTQVDQGEVVVPFWRSCSILLFMCPGEIATLKNCSQGFESSSQGKPTRKSFYTRIGGRMAAPSNFLSCFLNFSLQKNWMWLLWAYSIFKLSFLFSYLLFQGPTASVPLLFGTSLLPGNHWERGSHSSVAGVRTPSPSPCRKPTGYKILHSGCYVRWCVHSLLVFIFISESVSQIFLYFSLPNSSSSVHHHLYPPLFFIVLGFYFHNYLSSEAII